MTKLRVVTWNLQGSKGVDVAGVAAVLRQATGDADIQIIGLQEVQRRQARALARRWGAVDWRWTRKHFPYGPLLWWRAEGLAVLARHDLDQHQVTSLTPGIHSWSYRRRILQQVVVDAAGPRIWVFNTHLASHGDRDARAAQAAIVAGRIAGLRPESAHDHEILVGDLNAPDEPGTLAPFTAIGLYDAWPLVGHGPGYSNPSGAPDQRLDYVLAGASLAATAAIVAPGATTVTWAMLSDHLPVVATLRIADEPLNESDET